MGAYFPSGSIDLMCRSNLPEWLLFTMVRGDSDLYITQNTIQPGGQSGWHTHPGPSLVTVTEGTVTVHEDNCTSATYSVGRTFSLIWAAETYTTWLMRQVRRQKLSQCRLFRTARRGGSINPTRVAHNRLLAPDSERKILKQLDSPPAANATAGCGLAIVNPSAILPSFGGRTVG